MTVPPAKVANFSARPVISGRVTNSAGTGGVGGVTIIATNATTPSIAASTKTASSGVYSLAVPRAGVYNVRAVRGSLTFAPTTGSPFSPPNGNYNGTAAGTVSDSGGAGVLSAPNPLAPTTGVVGVAVSLARLESFSIFTQSVTVRIFNFTKTNNPSTTDDERFDAPVTFNSSSTVTPSAANVRLANINPISDAQAGTAQTWSLSSGLPSAGTLKPGTYLLLAGAVDTALNSTDTRSSGFFTIPTSAGGAPAAGLSTGKASSTSGLITLSFDRALNVEASTGASYSVSVNGTPAEVQSVSINGNRLTPSLDGLAAGARVSVSWSGLKSASGQSLSDSTSLSAG